MSRPVGYRKARIDYKRQYSKEIMLLQKGLSLRDTAKLTGRAVNTIRKLKIMFR